MAEKEPKKEEEKPKKRKLSLVKASVIGIGTILGMGSIDAAVNGKKLLQIGYPKFDKRGKPAVGCTVELDPDTPIYTSFDSALYKNDPHNISYPDVERIVKTAYYSTSNGCEFVGMDEYNYQHHEQEILDNGGRLVVVLTVQVDNQNEPEGFINASDIKTKDVIQGLVKK